MGKEQLLLPDAAALARGYRMFVGGVIIRRRYTGVVVLPDGRVLVDVPVWTEGGVRPAKFTVVDAR